MRRNAFAISTALALGLFTAACSHPSPARAPVEMVRVDRETQQAVPCHCADDRSKNGEGEDEPALIEEDETNPRLTEPRSVAYVPMTEWQAPESAQRVEAEITPRGDEPPKYIQFPQLRLHRPIDNGSSRALRYWR